MLGRGPREKGKVEKRWTKGGLDVSAMIRFLSVFMRYNA